VACATGGQRETPHSITSGKMEAQQMKAMVLLGVVAGTLALGGCALITPPSVPSFLTSDNLTQIEVINNQTGQKGLASKEADNIYSLLGELHLGDITANTRTDAPEPPASVYIIIVHDATRVVWSVQVLDAPQSSRVYLNDAVHAANNGIYSLKQPILIADLDQFVRSFPAP
jgi:hypothetical protein